MKSKADICRITLKVFYADNATETVRFTRKLQHTIAKLNKSVDLERIPNRKIMGVFDLPRGIEFEINPFGSAFETQLEVWTRDRRFQNKLLYGFESLILTRSKFGLVNPFNYAWLWCLKWKIQPAEAWLDIFKLIYMFAVFNIAISVIKIVLIIINPD
jgi:hypothetical protein